LPFLFISASFLGAFLLFCVEPMIAKMVLPQFGGSPAVWNTCMVFFQVALLAGYGVVHATSGWLDARRQSLFHLGVLALPIAALPIAAPASLVGGGYPSLQLLARLLTVAGLPFFAVATTAPLLQRWFAATSDRRAGDPYFLYAASNAGSLLALVGYVTLIERKLTLGAQARLWAVGYAVLAGLIFACAVTRWRAPASNGGGSAGGERIGARERIRWVALAFAPSSLLLGVTTYLTTDLAQVPLLWVIPLTLYLLSFILAFASPPAWVPRACALALPPAIVAALAVMVVPSSVPRPQWVTFLVHLVTFFLAATACHVELARRRPAASRLTEFYLTVTLGGALGGLFNALVAPVIFTWLAEYPLGLALAALLTPAAKARTLPRGPRRRAGLLLDVTLPLLLGLAAYLAPRLWVGGPPSQFLLVPLAACLLFILRPLRFALSLAIIAAVNADFQDASRKVVLRERSFFGTLRVSADFPAGMNTLAHGKTIHGMQRRSPIPSVRRIPLMYYFPTGPIGQVFEAYNRTPVVERVGVIGLGVGSLAAYGMSGQKFTFFEIDPAVERIARTPAYFHFLADCRAHWRVVLGDARLSLSRETNASYGLIVLDAFSGDAIPVHLLTREALRIYLAKLADGGLIAFHISNNYLDLEPAVGELARDAGLVGLDQNEVSIPPDEFNQGRMASHWVVLARRQADLSRLAGRQGWRPLTGQRRTIVWTDDYTDLISLLRR
jgi:hypothetical protein